MPSGVHEYLKHICKWNKQSTKKSYMNSEEEEIRGDFLEDITFKAVVKKW